MSIDHTSNRRISCNYFSLLVVTSTLILAPTVVTLLYFNPSSTSAQSSNSSKQTSPTNTTSPYLKKLQKNLGSNSQIMANNTKIGNGHTFQTFGKEHKIKASTPQSIKALPLNPKLRNMTLPAASAGGGGNKTGANMTNATSGTEKTNATSGTEKNMTGAAMGGIKSQHHLGGGKPAG